METNYRLGLSEVNEFLDELAALLPDAYQFTEDYSCSAWELLRQYESYFKSNKMSNYERQYVQLYDDLHHKVTADILSNARRQANGIIETARNNAANIERMTKENYLKALKQSEHAI